jgi:hypothetical protein
MAYIVNCRKKDENGEIISKVWRGWNIGLRDKKDAMKVFKQEIESGEWDAAYVDKRYDNGKMIEVDCWYKNPELA